MKEEKIAIIDLGSNTLRMIIMQIHKNGFYEMIDEAKETVRLSEDMGEEMLLKPEPMKRVLHALRLFKKLVQIHHVEKIIPIATAALRYAQNQKMFLEQIKAEIGWSFRVISGEEEAYYGYMGVINTIQIENCLIMDVGGVSTELVWVEGRKIKAKVSLPYGAVLLTEKFGLHKNETKKKQIEKLERFILSKAREVAWLKKTKGLTLIGLGGSIRTLAKINKRKKAFPLENLHNYQMQPQKVASLYEKLIEAGEEGRAKISGLDREREDIIVGGIAPLKVIMEYMKAEQLVISDKGLREGIFFENYLKEKGHDNGIIRDVLSDSVDHIINRYGLNKLHGKQVEKLSLIIFDATKALHKMGDQERKLLSISALIHDIGKYVTYYNHHKHGFYLILNAGINGLTHRELVICAFVVGMYGNAEFKSKWKTYGMLLKKGDYGIIRRLEVILSIGAELDRTEAGHVIHIDSCISSKAVEFILEASGDVELEVFEAMKNNRDFKKLFKRELRIEMKACEKY